MSKMKEKKQRNEKFTEKDFAELAITPLMSSEKNRKDVILESIKLNFLRAVIIRKMSKCNKIENGFRKKQFNTGASFETHFAYERYF